MAEKQQVQVFEKGAEIEVRPDDEGFSGSWYEAAIFTIVPKKRNPNPNPNFPNLYYDVQYKTLLADNEKAPLKERVRADFIRPLPPKLKEEEFGLDDVVEAFYQDGWWIGVVTKVLSNNDNIKVYEVTFKNPPDRINFRVSELRVHLDWVDGEWVRPTPIAKKVQESKDKSEDQTTGSMKRKGRLFKIQCKGTASSTGGVDTAEGQERDLTIDQRQDKSEDQTTGSMKRNGRLSKIQSKSFASSAGGVDAAEGHERDVTTNQMAYQTKSKDKSLQKNKGMPAKTLGESGVPENISSSETEMNLPRKGRTVEKTDQTGMPSSKRRRTQNADSSVDNVSKEAINAEKEEEGSKDADDRSKVGIADGNRQSPSNSNGICPNRNVQDLTDSANGSEFVEQGVASAAAVEGNGGEVINPNIELAIGERATAVEENGGIDSNNQDLEISVAANKAVEVNVIDNNNEKYEMEKRVSAVKGTSDDSNDRSLPFVKTFPLWNQIESMQVFQAIPQRPHFRMLVDACPENCREGMAVGYMVTFCSVAKKASEFRWDNERSSIEECFETLAKLEENGFDVKLIHDRLSSLLSKKDEHNLLLDQLKEHENQIMEHNCEKKKMVEEIDELDKQIKELLEKRDIAMSMGECVEREMVCFESNLKSVCQEINNSLFDFKQAAASPL